MHVSAPLGQYDSSKLVNLGTNRWSIKPELGISKAWGPLTLELAPSVTFYTDNDDFLNGMTREQDPLYALQGHLVYSMGYGIWGALDSTYYIGGSTKVDGVENDDRQENWRVGATLSVPISRRHSIKFYGSTGGLDPDRQRFRRARGIPAISLGPGAVAADMTEVLVRERLPGDRSRLPGPWGEGTSC